MVLDNFIFILVFFFLFLNLCPIVEFVKRKNFKLKKSFEKTITYARENYSVVSFNGCFSCFVCICMCECVDALLLSNIFRFFVVFLFVSFTTILLMEDLKKHPIHAN